MDLQLKGKRAILAGATKGIGRAVAEVLAAEGCAIQLCARDQAGVDSAVEKLRAGGANVGGESVDLGNAEAYRAWVARAAENMGGCDIFICFGSAGGGPASEERFQAAFELDLLATYRGIEAALPALEKSDSASVVVISTTVAIEPAFGPQPYAALKAAVTNYAGALAHSLAPKGIRVNTVSPGPILAGSMPATCAWRLTRCQNACRVSACSVGSMNNGVCPSARACTLPLPTSCGRDCCR